MIPILAKRDFMSRVKGAPYIITTILGMLVFVGLAFVPALLGYLESGFDTGPVDVMVFEQTDGFFPYLQEVSEEVYGEDVRFTLAAGLDEKEAFQIVLDENMTGLLLIDPPLFTLATTDGSNMMQNSRLESLINLALTRANAERLGLSTEEMNTLFQRVDLRVRRIGTAGEDGEEMDSEEYSQSLVLAYFLLFMIYMALVMYGNMVASGVAEEKSSRIMEVMVATVKPIELMFGKIIGIGTLGILQFAIWIGTGLSMMALRKTGLFGEYAQLGFSLGAIPTATLMWFGLFFLLGFFFYASIFAAGGAVVSRVEEVNQVVTIILMVIIVGFFASFVSFSNPNSTFAVAASLIPFTSPMVMFSRLVLTNPPTIQVVSSVLILLASIVIGTWISSRIYRIGVLMYGKRPSVKEVWRYLKS